MSPTPSTALNAPTRSTRERREAIHGHYAAGVPRRIPNRWITTGLLVILYGVVLEWVYQYRVAPKFAYLGSRFRDPDLLNYCLAFALALALIPLLPRVITKASDFVIWVLYVMTAIPSILVPQFADITSRGQAMTLAVVVAANFAFVIVLAGHGPSDSLRIPLRPHVFWYVLILVTFATYGYMFVKTGLKFSFVSLTDVRSIRFDYRSLVAGNSVIGYVIRLQANAINPLFIAYGAWKRRFVPLAAGTVGQLLIFSVAGYKQTILSIPAVIVLTIALQGIHELRGRALLTGAILMSVVVVVIDIARNSTTLVELFVDRLLLAPGTLTAAYIWVYNGAPKDNFAHTLAAPLVTSAYNTTPAYYVGAKFIGDPNTAANANFFADGYANLGYIGVSIEAVFLVGILWALNMAMKRFNISFCALLLLVPAFNLANSSVFTSIFTGGFAFVFALALFLPDAPYNAAPANEPARGMTSRDVAPPEVALKPVPVATEPTVAARSPVKRRSGPTA